MKPKTVYYRPDWYDKVGQWRARDPQHRFVAGIEHSSRYYFSLPRFTYRIEVESTSCMEYVSSK